MTSISSNKTANNTLQEYQEPHLNRRQSENYNFSQIFNERNLPKSPATNALSLATKEILDGSDSSVEISKLASKILLEWAGNSEECFESNQQSNVRNIEDILQSVKDQSLEKVWQRVNVKLAKNTGLLKESLPDNASEIRDWLNNPENVESLQKINVLDLNNCDLFFVPDEIKFLSSLIGLNLSGNNLRNYELENLTNLRYLNLEKNLIEDITSLKNLNQLEHLFLSHNRIIDIDVIKNFTSLKSLTLTSNPLRQLTPLKYMRQITFLNISKIQVEFFRTNRHVRFSETERKLRFYGNPFI